MKKILFAFLCVALISFVFCTKEGDTTITGPPDMTEDLTMDIFWSSDGMGHVELHGTINGAQGQVSILVSWGDGESYKAGGTVWSAQHDYDCDGINKVTIIVTVAEQKSGGRQIVATLDNLYPCDQMHQSGIVRGGVKDN